MLGAAPSARAAKELQAGAGIPSTSVDRLLGDLAAGRRRIDDRTVVVCDEAAMLGTRRLAALVDAVTTGGGKLVTVGDPKQLPEVDAGGLFAALAHRLGYVALQENRRQVDPEHRHTLALLRAGQVDDAVGRMLRDRQVVTADNADLLRDALVGEWRDRRRDGQDVVMMARRRHDTADLNHRARQLLIADGQLDEVAMVIGDTELAVGDRVLAHRNRYDLGIVNADRGTVVGVADNRLLVDIDADGGPRRVRVPVDYIAAGHLTHGYAATVHKNQGVTCDTALVLADDGLFAELGYSALTRGRHDNRLYLVATEREEDHGLDIRPDPFRQLKASLRNSKAKAAVIDQGSGLGL